jgi:hypothetical protein
MISLGHSERFVHPCRLAFVNRATDKFSGQGSENIFARSGSATRIHEIESIFNDAKHHYGKGLDWRTGDFHGRDLQMKPTLYDVYDAASCLLRYLKLLAEPIIPFDLYDQFTTALSNEWPPGFSNDGTVPEDFNVSKLITTYQQLINSLPPLNRALLLYLLDLLAVFASKSDRNHMTSPRIVAAFQPAFLSRPPSKMSASDHVLAADTMVFLVENQDHFLIGMSGKAASDQKDEAPASTPLENARKAALDDISELSSHSVGRNSDVSDISQMSSAN